jgi:hypothetical protein
LSPYLFILAIDTLQCLLEIGTEEGHLTPLRGRHAKLRLSLYTDDVVVFSNPFKEDVSLILQIMDGFGKATGLRLNTEKSSVAPIRCRDVNLQDILQDFSGQQVVIPLSYLGLPLTLGRPRLVHLRPILDRAKSRLAGWQGRLLNPAGHLELVRSVLSSIPIYLLRLISAALLSARVKSQVLPRLRFASPVGAHLSRK